MELFHMRGVSPNNQSGEAGLQFPDSDDFVVPGACEQAPAHPRSFTTIMITQPRQGIHGVTMTEIGEFQSINHL